MSLRTKTIYILAGIIITALIILATVGRSFWLGRYASLEDYYVRLNVDRVTSALDHERDNLTSNCRDWSAWDDTYNFVVTKDRDYINSNIVGSTFIESGFDIFIITDAKGRLVLGRQYDSRTQNLEPIASSLNDLISSRSFLLNIKDTDRYYEGIYVLPEGPVIIAAQPILTSNYQGPARGTMMVGRYINSGMIQSLSHLTRTDVNIHLLPMEKNSALPGVLQQEPESFQNLALIQPLNDQLTSGYKVLNDVMGKPAMVMQVSIPRKIYLQGVESFNYFFVSYILGALALYLLMLKLVGTLVLRKIETLNNEVSGMGQEWGLGVRVAVKGNDEVTSLAHSINAMLETIEASHAQVMAKEREYRKLFEDNITANFICDRLGNIVLCNQAFVNMFEFDNMDCVAALNVSKLLGNEEIFATYLDRLKKRGYRLNLEMSSFTDKGKPIVVIGNFFVDLDAEGEVDKLTGYLFDITERKSAEERIRYLGSHDPTTGLYNRSYFESRLKAIDEQKIRPVSVIMCDIDGLKLVNDTMGVEAGDALLRETARILKMCVTDTSLIARIGGDEFAVLLHPSQAKDNLVIADKIRGLVDIYNSANPKLPLSLSLGTSRVGGSAVRLTDLYQEADNYMYREKLQHTQSGRSSLVAALNSTLEARDYITEGHAERLQVLAEKLARIMNLAEHRITDLKLFARFHDIGKVGIPDHILNKPGRLSEDEWEEMQRHSEIGYRIAQAAPELHHISDWILKHHEWWNGQGYPLGLRGLDIPMESRLLAIVDAYDAMTSDRPYRKALETENALLEIKQQAGKQFDPIMVDRFLEVMVELELQRTAATVED